MVKPFLDVCADAHTVPKRTRLSCRLTTFEAAESGRWSSHSVRVGDTGPCAMQPKHGVSRPRHQTGKR
ncbi:hypothetical protein AB9N12_15740 [Bacteroides sp. AN502(2024)]|uniref:hypothetical protein n=1 Tax=Bacteroides sp. AN502(2024) TaxID=3160599 RepID=UPI00351599D7